MVFPSTDTEGLEGKVRSSPSIDVVGDRGNYNANRIRGFIAATRETPGFTNISDRTTGIYTSKVPKTEGLTDPEDTARYQRDHVPGKLIGTDGAKEGFATEFRPRQINVEALFSYFGSGVRDGYPIDTHSEKWVDIDTKKKPMEDKEFVSAVHDLIGESVMRTGRRLPPEDKERLARALQCDQVIKTVWLRYAQATGTIRTRDYNLSPHNLN